MWRKTTFMENQDSDNSISEDEDLGPNWPGNCIPLGGTSETKGGILIQSQLELLRDTHELDQGTRTTDLLHKDQRLKGFSSDDEVEAPVFHENGEFISSARMALTCNLDEEFLSDNEKIGLHNFGSKKPVVACTWSAVTEETEALAHSIENVRQSSSHTLTSNVNKPCKGGLGKAKSKYLFRFQPHKDDTPWPVNSKNGDNASSKGEQIGQSVIYGVPADVVTGRDYSGYSMVEILDSYQEKTGLVQGNSKTLQDTRTKGQGVQLIDERNMSPFIETNMYNDDPPEAVDSGSSSDEVSAEANISNLGLIVPESRQKTMTDKFQEALGAVSVNNEGSQIAMHGIGIFGKLQQVMQIEKKRDVGFLERFQAGVNSNEEESCIDVKILSRCLESKLTVCCCSLSRDRERSQRAESPQRTRGSRRTLTIIFSLRVCSDVELEVGKLIRIHSPWKEVQLRVKDEFIILSSYFSQISI